MLECQGLKPGEHSQLDETTIYLPELDEDDFATATAGPPWATDVAWLVAEEGPVPAATL